MPRSDELAASFMSTREGSTDHSDSAPVDVCDVRNLETVLGHSGCGDTPSVPAGVNYDPKPWLQNPRSIADFPAEYDPEGKKK
jgi:hypothetical protein